MKLLVTGGAGFIGSNFILYWMNTYPNDLVINFDNLTYAGNLKNLEPVAQNPAYFFMKGDICDSETVDRAMEGVEVIIHFAAETHVDRSITGPAVFLETNIIGTQVLLDAALKHEIKRFHHVSTDEVFGSLDLDSKDKFTEKTNYNPRSPYSVSKAASDHLVRAYHSTYGLPITITNCSNNFGPYQFPEKFIPLAITNALEGKKIPVYGDGLYVRDWLYVEDHVRAIDLVLKKGKAGETYLVGGGSDGISNLEVVKKILKITGKDESLIEFVKDRPGHDRKYAVDWSKIQNELGWAPEFGFDSWLEKTIQWYRKHESWWKEIKNGAYMKYYEQQYGKEL